MKISNWNTFKILSRLRRDIFQEEGHLGPWGITPPVDWGKNNCHWSDIFQKKKKGCEVGKLWWEEAMHKWQLLFGFPSEEIERIASVRCASDNSFLLERAKDFLDALALIKYLSYRASSSWFSGLFLQRKKNKALFFIISINQIETLYPLFKKENHNIKNIFNNCLGEVWQHWFWAIS